MVQQPHKTLLPPIEELRGMSILMVELAVTQ